MTRHSLQSLTACACVVRSGRAAWNGSCSCIRDGFRGSFSNIRCSSSATPSEPQPDSGGGRRLFDALRAATRVFAPSGTLAAGRRPGAAIAVEGQRGSRMHYTNVSPWPTSAAMQGYDRRWLAMRSPFEPFFVPRFNCRDCEETNALGFAPRAFASWANLR